MGHMNKMTAPNDRLEAREQSGVAKTQISGVLAMF
jgi:hypothetical protein